MIATKQAKHRIADNKQIYSDNTDKKRVRRPMLTGKADLQVAELITAFDLRENHDLKELEICVRIRQSDGEINRSWIKANMLDYEDDEEKENKLLKLLDQYEELTKLVMKEKPELTPFYSEKVKLMAVMREKLKAAKYAIDNPLPVPVLPAKEEASNDFMKKYGGKLNYYPGFDLKKKLFREFVHEYCVEKLEEVEGTLADEYTHLDFSKLIAFIRRNFEMKYRELVIQKLRTNTTR